MFKKLLISSAIMAISSSVAFANAAPYIGAGVGVKTTTATAKNYRGMPANVFVGFGGNVGNGLYLGGEIFSTLANGSITDNGLKSTYGYGVSFMPGVMLSDHTLGYARLGMVRTRFTPLSLKDSTITGTQVGAGMQSGLMQNWDIRGEYVYTNYNTLPGVVGALRSDEFNLGLVYKFD
jgi:opacity protein-like surface antigen